MSSPSVNLISTYRESRKTVLIGFACLRIEAGGIQGIKQILLCGETDMTLVLSMRSLPQVGLEHNTVQRPDTQCVDGLSIL